MNSKVIIQASARLNGNTQKVVDFLNNNNDFDVITLADKNINYFDYGFKNSDDDFLMLIKNIIEKYNIIIFATPMYWYTMSGHLKVFLDRISDLLVHHKELGRKFRGKKMGFISNSADNDRPNGFEMPFKKSADYLGMEYLGDVHAYFLKEDIRPQAKEEINMFRKSLG